MTQAYRMNKRQRKKAQKRLTNNLRLDPTRTYVKLKNNTYNREHNDTALVIGQVYPVANRVAENGLLVVHTKFPDTNEFLWVATEEHEKERYTERSNKYANGIMYGHPKFSEDLDIVQKGPDYRNTENYFKRKVESE